MNNLSTVSNTVIALHTLNVYEYNQPTASVPPGKGPGLPGTVTWVPDGSSTTTLASVPLSLGPSGCATIPVNTAEQTFTER